jgi:hypothetical protein
MPHRDTRRRHATAHRQRRNRPAQPPQHPGARRWPGRSRARRVELRDRGRGCHIWHASAGGTYSGEESNGTVRTYLRGIQPTDANGLAIFKLFFRDSVTDAVYKRAPYKSRGERSMRTADDSIYGSGGSRSLLAMTTVGEGYAGAISMGVRRS